MKARLLLLTTLALLTASALPAQSLGELRGMFWRQIAQSCSGSVTWQKSVTNTSDPTVPVQQIAYQIDCATGHATAAGSPVDLPWEEFSYLFQYDFGNPYMAPKLAVTRGVQGLAVAVKPEHAQDCPLQALRFDIAGGLITSAEVSVHKSNVLYDLRVTTRVEFHPDGRYAGHRTTTSSDVMMGSPVSTLIEARLLP